MITYAKRVKPKHVRLIGTDKMGNPMPIDLLPRGPVQFEMTNIHGRKISMGDPGPDSHPTNSTITQHSWAGGGQMYRANVASDMQRFYWSTLMTEYDHYLSLPFETFTYAPVTSSSFSMCLGDYPASDNADVFFQIEEKLYAHDPGTNTLIPIYTIGSFRAVGAGVVYRIPDTATVEPGTTHLFVPGGITGLGDWDGVNFIPHAGANVVDLAVWDEKLFMLTNDGKVWWSIDPFKGIHPVGWEVAGTITDGSSPRHLVTYVNRADADTLFIITSSAVFALDFETKRLIKSYFSYPRHPRQGHGAEHWRAELWTSVGMGAHRYDLSQVIPAGIDRDQGVPPEYRGYVTDIVGSYNDLFMYIRGAGLGATGITETETVDVGGGDETLHADATITKTNNLVIAWNGIGFHYRWAGAGVNPGGNMYVSQANDAYNLFWCNDGQILGQKLPMDYFNPLDPPDERFTFAEEGELITPWYDWNWPDQVKILKKLEFGVRATKDETIRVDYQLNTDDEWTNLTTLTEYGRLSFPVGIHQGHELMPDGVTPCYIGAPHTRFRLRFYFHRGEDKTKRPSLDWWSAVGRRVLNPIRTWRFNVDLTRQDNGLYPADTVDKLVAMATDPYAVQFDIWDESYMVEVVALAGPKDTTGQEFSGFLTIHLLEANDIEVPLGPPISMNGHQP